MKLSDLVNELFGGLGYKTIYSDRDGVIVGRKMTYAHGTIFAEETISMHIDGCYFIREYDEIRVGKRTGSYVGGCADMEKEAYGKLLKILQYDVDWKIERDETNCVDEFWGRSIKEEQCQQDIT